jgi:DNA-binding transcriptional MerR regulator
LSTLSPEREAQLDTIGFVWRVDGQTLDDTRGLLSEAQFMEESGLSSIAKYRRKGLIKPVGFGITSAGLSPFYHPKQIKQLKEKLGFTLDGTKGLLSENEFRKASGLGNIASYRRNGLIKPMGFVITNAGLAAYYHPRQINELKKKLGITLDDTTGLLNEHQISKLPGLTAIGRYRKRALIKPIGVGMSASKVSYVYRPEQIGELKKKLGITLDDTKGLLNEKQFREASGFTNLAEYRRRGIIVPVGKGVSATKVSFFYRKGQMKELREKLRIKA